MNFAAPSELIQQLIISIATTKARLTEIERFLAILKSLQSAEEACRLELKKKESLKDTLSRLEEGLFQLLDNPDFFKNDGKRKKIRCLTQNLKFNQKNS